MTLAHVSITVALWVDLLYGLLVFFTNPRRSANQQYLVLSLCLGAWLGSVLGALLARSSEQAQTWIGNAFVATTLIPAAFNLVRMAIRKPEDTGLRILGRAKWVLSASILFSLLCKLPGFIKSVDLVHPGNAGWVVAEPAYGLLFPVWSVFIIGIMGWVVFMCARDFRVAQGMQRVELQFLLLGTGSSLLTGMVLSLLIPSVTGSSATAPLAPISVILLNGIVAYGIATRRILGVATVLQRLTAYALVAIYLCLVYWAVLYAARGLLGTLPNPPADIPYLLAAIAAAMSMLPAHAQSQKIALRLFRSGPLDVTGLVQQAGMILRSISTLDELLKQFVPLVQESLGAESVTVCLSRGDHFVQMFPPPASASETRVIRGFNPLVTALQAEKAPLVVETVSRWRPHPNLMAAAQFLIGADARVGVGIYSKGALSGIMLLGRRKGSRIYGAAEEEVLQILCNQLGVAVENARLFTETENSRIYNNILLDSLVSGVVAIGGEGRVAVCNREAHRILRSEGDPLVGRALDELPGPIRDILRRTLDSGQGVENQEVSLAFPEEDLAHVRVGSAVFRAGSGEILGGLLVMHDVTATKQLEAQIRHSDRLASLGTLSAGMAHEIKNPLVTIRTFTQLLPERYDDAEFRDTFFSLVGDEVKRIDSIVNQLLTFARPAKPHLAEMHLHETLDSSLRLVHEELRRKSITVEREYAPGSDVILGDADLLSQAFVNFFLNSQDAMERGGRLTVATRISNGHFAAALPRHGSGAPARRALLVEIADTGHGIKQADLERVFDPFFTTKSHGTGLGLTVSHGIIREHGGTIEVRSEVGRGTAILISLPAEEKEAQS
jgi:signal transduction histidine kinase